MPTEIALLDDILLHMNHGLVPLSGTGNDRRLNFLAGLLLHRAFGSLWRAREDAVCGYPVQTLTLCRAALEDWGTLCYVERHPDDVGLWLRGVLPEIQASGRPPKFSQIWNELGDLGEIANEAYRVLSKFAHPRDTGLPWLFHADVGKVYFHTGGHFDESGLRMCLYFLVVVAQPFLERIAQLQSRVLGDAIVAWVREGKEISERASRFIERVHGQIAGGRAAEGILRSEPYEE
jgi:hypothetical protein